MLCPHCLLGPMSSSGLSGHQLSAVFWCSLELMRVRNLLCFPPQPCTVCMADRSNSSLSWCLTVLAPVFVFPRHQNLLSAPPLPTSVAMNACWVSCRQGACNSHLDISGCLYLFCCCLLKQSVAERCNYFKRLWDGFMQSTKL